MRYITANVGDNLLIGHDAGRTVVQSMCNCDTNDIDAAVAQCRELYEAGSQLVRLTTQGLREVESLGRIKAACGPRASRFLWWQTSTSHRKWP